MESFELLSPLSIIERPMKAFAAANQPLQPDLLYMKSVLVSTGKNANDDVFLPLEMWNARATPILKPVDWEHNTGYELIKNTSDKLDDMKKIVADNQIIGVMYNSYVSDKTGNPVTEEMARANDFQVPNEFDIVNEAVIFKYLFPTVAAKIVKEANEDKLFVSMEAWFNGFDYRIGNKVVARNDETVFLDRFLRANGGEGKYKGEDIGRVLRNIVFGGVGIVARPANKDSVIQSFTNAELQKKLELDDVIVSHVIGNICSDSKESKDSQEAITIMDENKPQDTTAMASVDDYKEVIRKLVKAEHVVETRDAELASAQAEIDALKTRLETTASTLSKGMQQVAAAFSGEDAQKLASADADTFFTVLSEVVASKLAAADSAVAEIQAKLDETVAKLNAIEAERITAARIAQIRDVLNLVAAADDSDEVKAMKDAKTKKMHESCAHLDDEAFASWLGEMKELITLAATPPWMKKDEDKKEEKEKDAKADEETDAAILDTVKATASVLPAGVDNPAPAVDLTEKFKSLASDLLSANKKTRFDYSSREEN